MKVTFNPFTGNLDFYESGSGYLLDTGATTGATSQAQSFTNGVKTGKIYPASDSTTALQLNKADGTTNVLNIDTTNARVGIGVIAPTALLHLAAGLSSAEGAPLKFSSGGALLSSPEEGAIEYNDANLFYTDANSLRKTLATQEGFDGGQTICGGIYADNVLSLKGNSALIGNTAANSNIEFSVGNGASTKAMVILNNGNVGIGTDTPSYLLSVKGNMSISDQYDFYMQRTVSGSNVGYKMYGGIGVSTTSARGGFRPLNSNTTMTFDVVPNGTPANTHSQLALFNTDFSADSVNYERLRIYTFGTYYGIDSNKGGSGTLRPLYISADGTQTQFYLATAGGIGLGTNSPTAVLHLKAGTASANTAPLKFTSGTLNTTAEAGAVEFLSDAYYGTITTGAARKTFAFLESPHFTGSPQVVNGNGYMQFDIIADGTLKYPKQTLRWDDSAGPAGNNYIYGDSTGLHFTADGDAKANIITTTINGLTPTAAATGFTIAGGTTSKTLTVDATLTASTTPIISTGTAAPATTPAKVGDIFVDTTNHKLYFSECSSSSACWIIAN